MVKIFTFIILVTCVVPFSYADTTAEIQAEVLSVTSDTLGIPVSEIKLYDEYIKDLGATYEQVIKIFDDLGYKYGVQIPETEGLTPRGTIDYIADNQF